MLRPKSRAGFTLIEMVVVLAVTTLMILWGTQAFAQTRQIQTERQFLTTTVALIEQGRAHATQSNFLVKVSFTDAGVVYQEFDSHHTVRLAMPKSLRLPHGGRINLMAQAMTAPKDIAFVTTRGVSYHIKPQLGWGVVHVTEEKM